MFLKVLLLNLCSNVRNKWLISGEYGGLDNTPQPNFLILSRVDLAVGIYFATVSVTKFFFIDSLELDELLQTNIAGTCCKQSNF